MQPFSSSARASILTCFRSSILRFFRARILMVGILTFVASRCLNQDFFMGIEETTITTYPGAKVSLAILVDALDWNSPVSFGCRGLKGNPLPEGIFCEELSVSLSAEKRTLAFPIQISPSVPAGTVKIEVVGKHQGKESIQPIEIRITNLEHFGLLREGTHMLSKSSWIRQIGTPNTDLIKAMVTDRVGNVYTAGYTTGTFTNQTSLGNYDAFLIKYRTDGSLEWLTQFGSSGSDLVSSLAITPQGDVVVAGYTYGTLPNQKSQGRADAFLAKYTHTGSLVWVKQIGTSELDRAHGVAVDTTGNIFLVGDTEGSFQGFRNEGQMDVFIQKYDEEGALLWTKQFGTNNNDSALSVSVLIEGSVFFGGSTEGAFPSQTSSGLEDAWLAQFDGNGKSLWLSQFGTYGEDRVTSVTVGEGNALYAAGTATGPFQGPYALGRGGRKDGFATRFSQEGTLLWVKEFGTEFPEEIFATVSYTGVLFVGGSTQGSLGINSVGGIDAFLLGFDEKGNLLGKKQFGTSANDQTTGLTVYANRFYIGGVTFGAFPEQMNEGDSDGFLYSFDMITK